MKKNTDKDNRKVFCSDATEWNSVGAFYKARHSLKYKNGKLKVHTDWLPHTPNIEDLGSEIDGEAYQKFWDSFNKYVLFSVDMGLSKDED